MPYLTANQPGIGGRLKVEPEDFVVEEIPLYLPSGQGQHVYFEIEKRGLSTNSAKRKIAQALNISAHLIGYAGLKDAQGCIRSCATTELQARIITEDFHQGRHMPYVDPARSNRHDSR